MKNLPCFNSSVSHRCTRLWWWLTTATVMPTLLMAQGANADVAPAEATAEATDITLITLFQQGGWAMWPLLAFSIAAIGLIGFCAFLIRENRFTQPGAVEAVRDAVASDDAEAAIAACDANPGYLTSILRTGLTVMESGHREQGMVNESMEERATKVLAGPMVFVQYLQVLASVSPMLGLLGTVSGMVKAFRNIASQGLGKPELLANNISEALVTTATGLLIAIPALMAYFYFKNRFQQVSSGIYERLGDLTRQMIRQGWLNAKD